MNFLIRFLCVILKCLDVILYPIFWLNSKRTRKSIPTISDGLLKISATDLAKKIRKREISSEQICIAYIKRIREVNPYINAVVEERFEKALQDARNVDTYLRTTSESVEELEKTKPLLGIPLTVKESCSVTGLSYSGGTLSRTGIKAANDGEAVFKLKSSGAIPLLVSNTPENCLNWESNNFITGRTNNPYDLSRTSSGSSGGEGALLGAGASLIGIGSDVAGSIRLPAMFNGVFGHKPTARAIPIKGHYPYCSDAKYPDFFAIGPMTRYAKDLKLMMTIMADQTVLPELKLNENVDLSKTRVFYMEREGNSFFLPTMQKEIRQAVNNSVEYLRSKCNCIIIEDLKFTELKNSCEIAGSALYNLDDIPNLLKTEKKSLTKEIFKSILGLSNYTFGLLFFHLIENVYKSFVLNDGYLLKNEKLKQLFAQYLSNDGVFLYPTFTKPAFPHGCFNLNCCSVSYLMIFNSLGLPSTAVPCGFDKNGLPIGIQVVAGPNQDRLCFAVAEELEKCFGGWIAPN